MTKDTIWKITGCVQHYPWGGQQYIPDLVCLANDEEKPFAELWFGQHPSCPSLTAGGTTLSHLMSTSPEIFFNPDERKRWKNDLPFLCKILDVNDMLSIQIHPDRQQASEGFLREEEERVNIMARNRTFKDRRHKPEIMFALSDFYLLHDFRSDEEVIEILSKIDPLESVLTRIKSKGLPDFYRWFMKQSQKRIYKILQPFVEMMLEQDIPEDPGQPDYWVRRAIDRFCTAQKIDRGIISFYLMNLVVLKPGEVIFQDSGIPHAYLRGQNIEVMANSDNVIRGGLTSKYIDSAAMSDLVRFDKRQIHRLLPAKIDDSCVAFKPPVAEFNLSVISLKPYQEYEIDITGITLLFSTANCFMVRTPLQEIRISGGEAALARAGESLVLMCRTSAQIFLVAPGQARSDNGSSLEWPG